MLKNEASHLNVKYRGYPRTGSLSLGGEVPSGREWIQQEKVTPASSPQPPPFSLLSLGHLFWETMWVLLSARAVPAKRSSHALNPAQVGPSVSLN